VTGRLERLYVDYTGREVRRGEKLAEIYSPELYAAQIELQAARRAVDTSRANGDPQQQTAEANLAAVQDRLQLWGLDTEQIAELERASSPAQTVTIRAPLGGIVVRKDAVEGLYVDIGSPLYTIADLSQVWVTLAAYESDLIWLRYGQRVTFTTPARPGREFAGEIAFIDPVLDDRTRTVEIRITARNPEGQLKPGMLVRARVSATLDAAGAPVPKETGLDGLSLGDIQPPLVVPASAPLWTGARSVVYVRLPGRPEPTFRGREVILGPRAGHYYLVVSGLVEGEQVVTNGNFKIDSALQIQARPSMMNPEAEPTRPTHSGHAVHSAPHDERIVASLPAGSAAVDIPDCFADRLEEILAAYFAVQEALAGDDDQAARAAAAKVATAVARVSCPESLSPPGSQEPWREIYGQLDRAAAQTQAAAGIGPRRLALQPLSDSLWTALIHHRHAVPDTVRRFHCPMAFEGAGAEWLQLGTTTANPYYGASMLRCGWQTDEIAPPAADTAPRSDNEPGRSEERSRGRKNVEG
jgi:Cu(I)/Ag(I) efflux system membrane fusion protein